MNSGPNGSRGWSLKQAIRPFSVTIRDQMGLARDQMVCRSIPMSQKGKADRDCSRSAFRSSTQPEQSPATKGSLCSGAFLLRSCPTLGRGALQLPGFTGLHVVPSATQVLQNAGALNFLLEHAQRRFDAIAFAEVYFDHRNYRPILTTFSAAGPFWP
jgi:hypothetical protein